MFCFSGCDFVIKQVMPIKISYYSNMKTAAEYLSLLSMFKWKKTKGDFVGLFGLNSLDFFLVP